MQSIIDILVDNRHKKYDLNSFGKEVVSFGRSSDCDIQIPKNYISRVHGCFYLENGEWFIKDMESTNGIYFNSNKIDALRLAVGPVRISKNMNSEDFIMISMSGAGFQPQPQFRQQPGFAQPKPQPQQQFRQQQFNQQQVYGQQQFNQQRMYQNRIVIPVGLKIMMIVFAVVMIVACFLNFYGTGFGSTFGKWGKYADDLTGSYLGTNLFSTDYWMIGVVIVINSILLIVFALLGHIHGLNIANVVISCFNPIWAIVAWAVFKGSALGFGSAGLGFYLLLAAGIGSQVVAIMILVNSSKQKKAMNY